MAGNKQRGGTTEMRRKGEVRWVGKERGRGEGQGREGKVRKGEL